MHHHIEYPSKQGLSVMSSLDETRLSVDNPRVGQINRHYNVLNISQLAVRFINNCDHLFKSLNLKNIQIQ